jgi:hypothetical protein
MGSVRELVVVVEEVDESAVGCVRFLIFRARSRVVLVLSQALYVRDDLCCYHSRLGHKDIDFRKGTDWDSFLKIRSEDS